MQRYPLTTLSIDKLEIDIIDYFENNSIDYNQCMESICIKYRLKYMYIHIHNKDLALCSRIAKTYSQLQFICNTLSI